MATSVGLGTQEYLILLINISIYNSRMTRMIISLYLCVEQVGIYAVKEICAKSRITSF